MVVRSAVVMGMIRNGGLGLDGNEARQNEQGKDNSEQFKTFLPRGRALSKSTHMPY
jgi:ABC-type phosphate/phosphonate transport system permease subunit